MLCKNAATVFCYYRRQLSSVYSSSWQNAHESAAFHLRTTPKMPLDCCTEHTHTCMVIDLSICAVTQYMLESNGDVLL